jgi:hypothetical protein
LHEPELATCVALCWNQARSKERTTRIYDPLADTTPDSIRRSVSETCNQDITERIAV